MRQTVQLQIKKYRIYIICLLLVLTCVGCSENNDETLLLIFNVAENEDSIKEITVDNCFTVFISNELACTQNDSNTSLIIKNSGGEIVGGIDKYIYEEDSLPSLANMDTDYFQFINNLGIQIDPNLLTAYTFSTGMYNGWEIWLHSDTMDITHNLIPYNRNLYNIWFNTKLVRAEFGVQILESIQFIN